MKISKVQTPELQRIRYHVDARKMEHKKAIEALRKEHKKEESNMRKGLYSELIEHRQWALNELNLLESYLPK